MRRGRYQACVEALGELSCSVPEQERRRLGALERFQELIDKYPDSEFRPAAMFKARACLLALGRKDEAWDLGGRLLQEYPQSDEAAQLKLERGDR